MRSGLFAAGLSAGLLLCFASAAGAAESAPAQDSPKPLDHSYVKLFTLVMAGPLKDSSQQHLEYIAKNYQWINSHGGEWLRGAQLDRVDYKSDAWEYPFGPGAGVDEKGRSVGQRLRELDPEIVLTNYRNGAYISQNAPREAMEAEMRMPLSIQVHDTKCKLAKPLGAEDTTVKLIPPPDKPQERDATYPWKASTTQAEYSKDKAEYVAWMRLGDEVLRIDGVSSNNGNIVLTVKRGAFFTTPKPHETNTVVLQPIYCGNRREDGEEYYLSGLPDGNSPQRALRYIMNQNRGDFWEFLAQKSEECIREGYDGPWFDCTVSEWINHSNAYGDKVLPYDVDMKKELDHDTYREYHQRKIDYMFERFPKSKFYVNWVFPQFYFDNGHDKYLFSGEGGHKPISGGAIEIYAVPGRMDWHELMKMQIDMRDNNYNVISWAKTGGGKGDADNTPQYLLYAYCTHLLVHEHDKPMTFGAKWRPDDDPEDPFLPPSWVFWDLGQPEQKFTDISEAQWKDAPGVYARQFSKGLVLVNPGTESPATVKLPESMFNTETKQWVSEVQMTPVSGALLLKK